MKYWCGSCKRVHNYREKCRYCGSRLSPCYVDRCPCIWHLHALYNETLPLHKRHRLRCYSFGTYPGPLYLACKVCGLSIRIDAHFLEVSEEKVIFPRPPVAIPKKTIRLERKTGFIQKNSHAHHDDRGGRSPAPGLSLFFRPEPVFFRMGYIIFSHLFREKTGPPGREYIVYVTL